MARKNKSAYQQAPWRRQLQTIGLSLLPVITIALAVSLYLTISAQAAAAGLEIMEMHYQEENILRRITNQRTQLAWMTSYTQMIKRAEKMSLEKAPPEAFHYMVIPGYQVPSPVLLADPPGSGVDRLPVINEYYQQSLWDWVAETLAVRAPRLEGGGQ
jgi:hypothetical protein